MPVGDLVHQAAHQADSSAVLCGIGAGFGGFRGGIGIEPGPGVPDGYRESGSIDFNRAADRLRGVIFATVKRGVGQGLLQRNKDVDLLRFAGAVRPEEVHHQFARRHHGLRISGKGEFPGGLLPLHGLS